MSDLSVHAILTRTSKAPLPGARGAERDRARRLLTAWAETAARRGATGAEIARGLRDGAAARDVSRALRGQMPAPQGLACRAGCAFCCILDGEDGGLVSEAEARTLHAALAPVAGTRDGRDWHPKACPALDPDQRTCRAYGARPEICNAYVSTDAAACETNAAGGNAPGGGVLGSHRDYLGTLSLSRGALRGIAAVQTYALREVARGGVEGWDIEETLAAARHRPKLLDEVRAGARALDHSAASSSSRGPATT